MMQDHVRREDEIERRVLGRDEEKMWKKRNVKSGSDAKLKMREVENKKHYKGQKNENGGRGDSRRHERKMQMFILSLAKILFLLDLYRQNVVRSEDVKHLQRHWQI